MRSTEGLGGGQRTGRGDMWGFPEALTARAADRLAMYTGNPSMRFGRRCGSPVARQRPLKNGSKRAPGRCRCRGGRRGASPWGSSGRPTAPPAPAPAARAPGPRRGPAAAAAATTGPGWQSPRPRPYGLTYILTFGGAGMRGCGLTWGMIHRVTKNVKRIALREPRSQSCTECGSVPLGL